MHIEAKFEWQKSCFVRPLCILCPAYLLLTLIWRTWLAAFLLRTNLQSTAYWRRAMLMVWHLSGLVINSSFECPSFHPAEWIMMLSLIQGIFYKLYIYWAFKHIDIFIHSGVKCLLCKVDTNDSWLMEL